VAGLKAYKIWVPKGTPIASTLLMPIGTLMSRPSLVIAKRLVEDQ